MNNQTVYAPFYQVKVAGHVVDQTNNREGAHALIRSAAAHPAELWRIYPGGNAELLERVTQTGRLLGVPPSARA